MAGTNLFAPVTSTLDICLTDADGLAVLAQCTGAAPTTAGVFKHGCIINRADSGTGVKALYENTGSTASPSWNLIGDITAGEITLAEGNLLVGNVSGVATALVAKTSGQILVGNGTTLISAAMTGDTTISSAGLVTIGAAKVTGAKLSTAVGYFTVAKSTNTTTPVNVIAATVPFTCTITGAYLVSKDTTASTITIADTAGTIATIAKGTVAGVMVGATSLSNTTVTSGDTLTIVSSGAGDAFVYLTFTVA